MILFNKISLTLVNPRKGHIYYRGKNIYNKRLDWTGLRKKVGLVFQYPETQLFKPTVIQDTMYGPLNMGLSEDQARERAQDSLSLVGLDKELFLANPSELSGGQKRCVAIAGVLAMQPEVLVLDEPTAGLDPQTVSRIFQVLQAIHRQNNCAILFVSHRMDEVEQYRCGFYMRAELVWKDRLEKSLSRMNGRITFGRYIHYDAFIHWLDPGTKLLSIFLIIILLFVNRSTAGYLLYTLFLLLLFYLSKISLVEVLKSLKVVAVLLIFTFIFRFIPILMDEVQNIQNAQISRGAEYKKVGVIARIKHMTSVALPLFLLVLDRASDLGNAIDSRGYDENIKRTRSYPLVFSKEDKLVIGFMLLFFIVNLAVILMTR